MIFKVFALVGGTVGPDVPSSPMFFPLAVLALVDFFVRVDPCSDTVLGVFGPVALVLGPITVELDAEAVAFAIFPLSSVDVSV